MLSRCYFYLCLRLLFDLCESAGLSAGGTGGSAARAGGTRARADVGAGVAVVSRLNGVWRCVKHKCLFFVVKGESLSCFFHCHYFVGQATERLVSCVSNG